MPRSSLSSSAAGAARLDRVPERLQQAGRVLGRSHAVGVDLGHAAGRVGAQPDAQLPGIGTDLVGVGPRRRRRAVRVTRLGSLQQVEHRGAVAHRPGDARAGRRSRPSPHRASGADETRPRVGFSPNRPHAARGDADRAAAVAGVRRRATIPLATAAADPPLEPPGLRVVSHGLRVGPYARGSVVGMRPSSGVLVLPDEHEAGGAEPPDERAVVVAVPVDLLQEPVALVARVAGGVAVEVLQHQGHAPERAVGQIAGRFLARLVEASVDHRVELVVELLDAGDRASTSSSGVARPARTSSACAVASRAARSSVMAWDASATLGGSLSGGDRDRGGRSSRRRARDRARTA